MKTDEIQAVFTNRLELFEPIVGQPTNADLTYLRDTLLQLLYPIPFDKETSKHNLIGLISDPADYLQRVQVASPP